MTEQEPCCFDEWAAHSARRARRKEVSAPVSRAMVAALDEVGLSGLSVMDLGCGAGDVGLAALARGATTLTGLDLGPGAIDRARSLAAERGLQERSSFSVGDAATEPLDPHDVVVLNRVYCCYPDIDGLLANSLPVARRLYAFTAPRSAGLAGAIARVQIRLANAWYRLRDRKFRGFRVFVHDIAAIDARVRAAGFRPVIEGPRRFGWHLGVYERVA